VASSSSSCCPPLPQQQVWQAVSGFISGCVSASTSGLEVCFGCVTASYSGTLTKYFYQARNENA